MLIDTVFNNLIVCLYKNEIKNEKTQKPVIMTVSGKKL